MDRDRGQAHSLGEGRSDALEEGPRQVLRRGVDPVEPGHLDRQVAVVDLVDDPDIEADESFTLELSNPGNAVLLTPSITVTIRDDDGTLLFEDGFDSGDLSNWSVVVP